MRKIIVGSRRSKLALTQSNWVIDQLRKLDLPFEFELKEIVTKGDRILDVTLSKVGGKGLFVKEIEQAMLNGEIDMAVHSMKDMPAVLPEGLMIGCIPSREDHRDVLISNDNLTLAELPEGAVVGTSSLRRSAQLLAKRPDLKIKWIRGNVDTRIQKLKDEDYDAIVLAAAGLSRLGWKKEVVSDFIDENVCIPAVGQGALSIECRSDDQELLDLLSKLTCKDTEEAVRAERVFLKEMEGGCQVPIAGYASKNEEGNLDFHALVASPDGKTIYREKLQGNNPEELGKQAAERLTERGAKKLIEKVKEEMEG